VRDALASLLEWLLSVSDVVVYLVLGALAALENAVPPVPADVVVLFGAVLAGRGVVAPWGVFLVVWACNVAGALMVYALGRWKGPGFFRGRLGRFLLRPAQLATLGAFYERNGFVVIFVSRFLPGFRALVPPFAGLAGIGLWRAAVPIACASAIWYGTLVYVGVRFGRSWERILALFEGAGRGLGLVAALLFALVLAWWWRSRHTPYDEAP
jgi:membrane protein DedA with SNARE-associated domain